MLTIKRRFALLFPLALVAMALMASSASAATAVKDLSGTSCSAVSPAITDKTSAAAIFSTTNYVSGGCTVHVKTAVGSWHSVGRDPYTNEINHCTSEFDAHVGPDGWGYANNFVYTCEQGPMTSASASRMIMPPEYNPSKMFPYDNAATDLQLSMFVNQIKYGFTQNYTGLVSFDIGAYDGVAQTQTWTNQQSVEPSNEFGRAVSFGKWTSSKQGLTITH